MDVIYLSVEAVEIFHERALREYGGSEGLRSRELLESAVFQPQQSAFGDDAYQSIAAKAAAYGFFIAQNQLFLTAISVLLPPACSRYKKCARPRSRPLSFQSSRWRRSACSGL